MKNPAYDLLLANLPGIRSPHCPDSCWNLYFQIFIFPEYRVHSGGSLLGVPGCPGHPIVGFKVVAAWARAETWIRAKHPRPVHQARTYSGDPLQRPRASDPSRGVRPGWPNKRNCCPRVLSAFITDMA
ncbi:hypothetical protein HPB48_012726 [Haemaphysalis longicornis]|uniref:Uncharacterized protein n=1 Tax=Haemaphysalis longicornis TaxID=44386 RepID=A0A9J6FV24_HAELO|nr:hypothetical protein HPB48_012726 [Haemaphysalis longicornis]